MEKFTNKNIQHNQFETGEPSLQENIWHIHNFENEDATRDEEIATVAKTVGRIGMLERQNSDSQDFHDISVWTLKEMLRVSYELGKLSQEAPVSTELQIGAKVKLKAFEKFDYYWGDMIQPILRFSTALTPTKLSATACSSKIQPLCKNYITKWMTLQTRNFLA